MKRCWECRYYQVMLQHCELLNKTVHGEQWCLEEMDKMIKRTLGSMADTKLTSEDYIRAKGAGIEAEEEAFAKAKEGR